MSAKMLNHSTICKIRDKLLSKVNQNVDLFDEIDVKRLLTDDYQIERFIVESQNEVMAFDTLVKALLWKKEYGVYDRNQEYFFRELLEIHEADIFGIDKQGRYIIWFNERAKNGPYIREFIELIKYLTVYLTQLYDQRAHRKGVVMVVNTQETEKTEVTKLLSLELIKFTMDLRKYYPEYARCFLIVDMPMIHKTLAKFVLSVLSRKLKAMIHFINRDQLTDFIDQDVIPKFLGGPRMTMLQIPNNVKPYYNLDHFNFSDKAMYKFFRHYNKEMNNKIET